MYVAAKKWGVKEAYLLIGLGLLGILVCIGMILLSGKTVAATTIIQVVAVTAALLVWAHIFYGTWRGAARAGLFKVDAASEPRPRTILDALAPKIVEALSIPRASANESQPSTVLLKSPAGHFQVNGIGIIRGVWIEFLKQPVEHWECTCVILFHELGVAKEASLLQLLLTGQDGQPELATLTATDALPTGAGKVIYTGNARTPEMQLCLQRTMSNQSALTIPPSPDTYCYVEVHIAPGQRIAHQKTTIRLDYELAKASCHGFFVPIIYKPLKSAVTFLASLQGGLQQALK